MNMLNANIAQLTQVAKRSDLRRRFLTPAPLLADGYKGLHPGLYPGNMQLLFSTWCPRSDKIALQAGRQLTHQQGEVVFFGLTPMLETIGSEFDAWFERDEDEVIREFTHFMAAYYKIDVVACDHIRALHKLQRLPLIVQALPEGTVTKVGIVQMIIYNEPEHPAFGWLVNGIESLLSTELWKPQTSASVARNFYRLAKEHADITCDNDNHLPWQCHDFAMRGLSGVSDSEHSAMGHLLFFGGTDTIPSLWAADYYYANFDLHNYGTVPATEHSIACTKTAAIQDELETTGSYRGLSLNTWINEFDSDANLPDLTLKQLSELLHMVDLMELYPDGILSIVSDTWDYWSVLTNFLPRLRERIMERNGKVVIRPDSGNPVKIICGDPDAPLGSPAYRGSINILGEIFGHTRNSKGFRELDPHIGLIYGDSITLDRAEKILSILRRLGWASNVVVLGIGSYTYQATTRDVFGFAMKATAFTAAGKEIPIFKDPATDDGTKKSFRGFLTTIFDGTHYRTIDGLTFAAMHDSPVTAFVRYYFSREENTDAGLNDWLRIKARANGAM